VPDIKDQVMQAMRDLPPMPLAVQKLLAVMNDERSSAEDVTRVLSSDQVLAGKVLKLVNSSYYGLSGEVATITRAVVILGFNGVRSVAMGFGMIAAMRKLGSAHIGPFWDHALAAGAGAQAIAELLGKAHDAEEAFIAGLMHDIGHIVLASAAPDAWQEAQQAALGGEDAAASEGRLLGMSHTQVGERLLRYWQLPEALQAAARWHHDLKVLGGGGQPLTALVALGDLLACIHGGGFERPLPEADLGRLLRLHGLGMGQVREALARMDRRIEEMQVFLRIADDHGDLPIVAPAAADQLTAVVLSTDDERVAWVGGLLQHFGCRLFPLKDYFGREPCHEAVRLVVLDPACMTAQHLAKMLPFLESQPAVTCVLRDGAESPVGDRLAADHPVLPYVFSRLDVQAILAGADLPV
jgi:HD-like signal output (HDOD) protein